MKIFHSTINETLQHIFIKAPYTVISISNVEEISTADNSRELEHSINYFP